MTRTSLATEEVTLTPEAADESTRMSASRQLERADARAPLWPVRRTSSAAFSLVLVLLLWAPVALAPVGSFLRIAALGPALLSALTTRFVFEALPSKRPWTLPIRLRNALVATLAGLALVLVVCAVLGADPPLGAVAAAGPAVCAVLLAAATARALEIRVGATSRRVFFLGSANQLRDLEREVRRRGDMRLVGSADVTRLRGRPGATDELLERAAGADPTTLVMSLESIRDEHLVAAASQLNMRGLRVRTLNHFYEQQFGKVPLSELSPSWFLFDVAEIHRARPYGIGKRVLETTTAALLLMLTAPLLPLIALAIKLSSRGPVFFRQQRVGKDGHLFSLTKFRTMTVAHDTRPAAWGTDDSHRVTSVGRVLRRFRLDEIPQLWHVVRGNLGLVGPRPEQPQIVERLERDMEFYAARHCVRPGLTGWAQINYGYGGSDRGTVEKLQYDFFYIKRQSLRLDLLIIASTLRIILAGRGR